MRKVLILSLTCLLATNVDAFVGITAKIRSASRLSFWEPVIKKKMYCEAKKKLLNSKESAEFLSEYMAISHEAKLKAVADATAKANEKIRALEAENEELKAKLEEIQLGPVLAPDGRGRIYEMPATNKALAEKFQAAQSFMAEYLVKASMEKYNAVKTAEKKLIERYEVMQ